MSLSSSFINSATQGLFHNLIYWNFCFIACKILYSIILTFGFVKACQPNLFVLGCFHLIYDIATTGLYFYMTYETKGWFDNYADGFFENNTVLVSAYSCMIYPISATVQSLILLLPRRILITSERWW